MSPNISISKIQINGEGYYLKLDWIQNNTDLFKLVLMRDNDANGWSGTFSNETAQKTLQSLYQTESDYFMYTKNCLMGKGGSDNNLITLDKSSQSAVLKWKKKFEGYSEVQGAVEMIPHTCEPRIIIDFLLDRNSSLQTTIEKLERDLEVMNIDFELCKQKLTGFVNKKTTFEGELYNKFVLLLNSKKRRIQELTNEIEKFSNNN